MNNADIDISVGGRVVNTIRYADDKAVVANSQKGLLQLMANLNKVTQTLRSIWKRHKLCASAETEKRKRKFV